MNRRLKFEKDDDNRWYVVLPEWTGDRAELEMVSGADTMLDILSEMGNKIELPISTEPTEHCHVLRRTEWDPAHPEAGATYRFIDADSDDYMDIWLCHVTTFVFGTFPDHIYIHI